MMMMIISSRDKNTIVSCSSFNEACQRDQYGMESYFIKFTVHFWNIGYQCYSCCCQSHCHCQCLNTWFDGVTERKSSNALLANKLNQQVLRLMQTTNEFTSVDCNSSHMYGIFVLFFIILWVGIQPETHFSLAQW